MLVSIWHLSIPPWIQKSGERGGRYCYFTDGKMDTNEVEQLISSKTWRECRLRFEAYQFASSICPIMCCFVLPALKLPAPRDLVPLYQRFMSCHEWHSSHCPLSPPHQSQLPFPILLHGHLLTYQYADQSLSSFWSFSLMLQQEIIPSYLSLAFLLCTEIPLVRLQ